MTTNGVTQLQVNGKPYLVISGEAGYNQATNLDNMNKNVWPQIDKITGLNTVAAAVYWSQFEPTQGNFDYTYIDGLIKQARDHHKHLVLLWYASWMTTVSNYVPNWVKEDHTAYPYQQITVRTPHGGRQLVNILSPRSTQLRSADSTAFGALLAHIKQVDQSQSTVIMSQIENEMGLLGDSRDRSPAATRAFAGQVPQELSATSWPTRLACVRSSWMHGRPRDIVRRARGSRSSVGPPSQMKPSRPGAMQPLLTQSLRRARPSTTSRCLPIRGSSSPTAQIHLTPKARVQDNFRAAALFQICTTFTLPELRHWNYRAGHVPAELPQGHRRLCRSRTCRLRGRSKGRCRYRAANAAYAIGAKGALGYEPYGIEQYFETC